MAQFLYLYALDGCSKVNGCAKPRLQAEWAVSSKLVLILASCCLSPIWRNSVLDELSVK